MKKKILTYGAVLAALLMLVISTVPVSAECNLCGNNNDNDNKLDICNKLENFLQNIYDTFGFAVGVLIFVYFVNPLMLAFGCY